VHQRKKEHTKLERRRTMAISKGKQAGKGNSTKAVQQDSVKKN
jgi:hypothetical protein